VKAIIQLQATAELPPVKVQATYQKDRSGLQQWKPLSSPETEFRSYSL